MRKNLNFVKCLTWFGVFLSLAASQWDVQAAPTPAQTIRVGLILDSAGKDDKSFNEAAYKGILRAKEDLGVGYKVVSAADGNATETLLRSFVKRNFDLVICVGVVHAGPLRKIAVRYPKMQFAIVDAEVDLPNVKSLEFESHEGSFLVGAIAALKSESGKVGFIGGMEIPLIRRFLLGYEAGAKAVRPDVEVVTHFVGVTGSAWNNPPRAKELALSQYSKGVDVIFGVAGTSNLGLFDAAEEKKRFAIGVDSNQNWIKPGRILTSMMKRVDVAVFETIKELKSGRFKVGTQKYGLANAGVGFSLDQFNKKLLKKDLVSRVERLKEQIVSGKLSVPDYYKVASAKQR